MLSLCTSVMQSCLWAFEYLGWSPQVYHLFAKVSACISQSGGIFSVWYGGAKVLMSSNFSSYNLLQHWIQISNLTFWFLLLPLLPFPILLFSFQTLSHLPLNLILHLQALSIFRLCKVSPGFMLILIRQ